MKRPHLVMVSITAALLLAAALTLRAQYGSSDPPEQVAAEELVGPIGSASLQTLRLRPRAFEPFPCALDTLGYLYVQADVCDFLNFTDTQVCICASVEGVADWTFISSSQSCDSLSDCP